MADQIINSSTFAAVTMPGVACKAIVHDAPVVVTFTAAGTDTRGLPLQPGDVIALAAGDQMRARRASSVAAVIAFEVFG